MSTANKAFAAITASNAQRGCDPKGCGEFGAPRGARKHGGIDFKALPGENIFSPISGKVIRKIYAYASDLSYTGLEIVNSTHKVQMFYFTPAVDVVGTVVKAGQLIGKAQNIAAKYGGGMINHVHFEVYDVKTGKLIDPTKLVQQ